MASFTPTTTQAIAANAGETVVLWGTADALSTVGTTGLSYAAGVFTNTTSVAIPLVIEYNVSWNTTQTGLYTFVWQAASGSPFTGGARYGELYYNGSTSTTNACSMMLAAGSKFAVGVNNFANSLTLQTASRLVITIPTAGQPGPTGPTGIFGGTVPQTILPTTAATFDLGSSTSNFRNFYYAGFLSNSVANTSNLIGGITLSNNNITTLTGDICANRFLSTATTSNFIGGIILSNNNLTTLGDICGNRLFSAVTTSNSLGGVTLSNNNLTTLGDICGNRHFSPLASSNNLGGVSLSNGYLRTAADISGVNIAVSGNIAAQGNITAGGDVTAFSDRRLKENIVNICNALNLTRELQGVFYTRIGDREAVKHLGFIAQDVESVVPEVVLTGTDTANTKSVAYGNLVALLVEAIKEMDARHRALDARVADLEKK
jgi:hypothetical protein